MGWGNRSGGKDLKLLPFSQRRKDAFAIPRRAAKTQRNAPGLTDAPLRHGASAVPVFVLKVELSCKKMLFHVNPFASLYDTIFLSP